MKKLKYIFAALFAIATVTGFASFDNPKNIENPKIVADQYWDFVGSGSSTIPDNRLNPEHYQLSAENPSCDGIEEICQVKAPADLTADPSGNTPDFMATVSGPNQSVSLRIQDAHSNGANETATLKDN